MLRDIIKMLDELICMHKAVIEKVDRLESKLNAFYGEVTGKQQTEEEFTSARKY